MLSSGTGSCHAEELGDNLLELRPFKPIHPKLCNSLNPKTVEKLVFIKSNLAAFYNFLQVVEYELSDSKNENY